MSLVKQRMLAVKQLNRTMTTIRICNAWLKYILFTQKLSLEIMHQQWMQGHSDILTRFIKELACQNLQDRSHLTLFSKNVFWNLPWRHPHGMILSAYIITIQQKLTVLSIAKTVGSMLLLRINFQTLHPGHLKKHRGQPLTDLPMPTREISISQFLQQMQSRRLT